MKNSIFTILTVIAAVVLCSCGSDPTVAITPAGIGKTYSKVVVREFSCRVPNASDSAKKVTKSFSREIAYEVTTQSAFSSVTTNGKVTADTLVISGGVTDYEEGNPALRFAVGMGVGAAYFVSEVVFIDGATNKTIGLLNVDQAIGYSGIAGALAKPESLVLEAAKNVATESIKFSKNIKN